MTTRLSASDHPLASRSRPAAETSPAATSTDEKVAFLARSEAYPHRLNRVEVVETHWSWVFLAGDRVYKLKKPLVSEHFDFSDLAAREANCRKEVELNRRLAGDVYLRVARLARRPDGGLALDGNGETVDWLVVMRRLPGDRMLDQMIAQTSFSLTELERLATRLAGFYAGQPAVAVAPEAYAERFRREQATNRAVLASCAGDAPVRYVRLVERIDAALVGRRPLLEERVLSGRIVDGHGDLRPEHICMTEPVVIFDCLEFSDELRQVDPVDELAFLGLECAVIGAAWVGPKLAESVMGQLGQSASEDLVALHTACRAMLRARLSLAHLLDPVPRTPEKWRPLAERYAAAADAALAKLGA